MAEWHRFSDYDYDNDNDRLWSLFSVLLTRRLEEQAFQWR